MRYIPNFGSNFSYDRNHKIVLLILKSWKCWKTTWKYQSKEKVLEILENFLYIHYFKMNLYVWSRSLDCLMLCYIRGELLDLFYQSSLLLFCRDRLSHAPGSKILNSPHASCRPNQLPVWNPFGKTLQYGRCSGPPSRGSQNLREPFRKVEPSLLGSN